MKSELLSRPTLVHKGIHVGNGVNWNGMRWGGVRISLNFSRISVAIVAMSCLSSLMRSESSGVGSLDQLALVD